jgi:hypothetical protein
MLLRKGRNVMLSNLARYLVVNDATHGGNQSRRNGTRFHRNILRRERTFPIRIWGNSSKERSRKYRNRSFGGMRRLSRRRNREE